jgi:hypothetical protein
MKTLELLFRTIIVGCLAFTVSCVSEEVPVTETYYATANKTETYTTTEDIVISQKHGESSIEPTIEWSAPDLWWGTPSSFSGKIQGVSYFGCQIPNHTNNHIVITFNDSPTLNYSSIAYDVDEQIGPPPERAVVGFGNWEYESGSADYPWSHELKDWLDVANSKLASTKNLGSWSSTIWSKTMTPMQNPTNELELDFNGAKDLAIVSFGVELQPVQEVKIAWCDNVTEKKTVTKERQTPYQIEKRRTVMQTKQVPFWEAIFH